MLNKHFFEKKRAELIDSIEDEGIIIVASGSSAHRSGDSFYPFVVNRNFFYLTGISQESSYLMIIKTKAVVKTLLIILPFDKEKEKWLGRRLGVTQAEQISGIDNIITLSEVNNYILSTIKRSNIKKIYMDFSFFISGQSLEKDLWDFLLKSEPSLQVSNLSSILQNMRLIKEKEEIECLKEAIRITKIGIEAIVSKIAPGVKESDLSAEFNYAIAKAGSRECAFPSIIASGKNSLCLHYPELDGTLDKDDLLLIDLGASYNNYCADISRTIPVVEFSAHQRKLFDAVLFIQTKLIEFIAPGVSTAEIENKGKELAREAIKTLGLKGEVEDYYWHSTGHHLGLDTHDGVRENKVMVPGMVITVEPGLYIEEWNQGVRIEDDVLITETGNQNLSADIPKFFNVTGKNE